MSSSFSSEPLYYVLVNRQQHGPYPFSQLREMWRTRIVSGDTLFWTHGQAGWEPLGKISDHLENSYGNNLGALVPPPLARSVTAPSPATPPLPDSSARPKVTGLAIASLVCGICSLLLGIPAILAVIFGHIARGRIRKSQGTVKGDRMALAGLVMGYVVIGVFAVATVVAVIIDHFHGAEISDLHNAKSIATAIRFYSKDHQGHTPPDLTALVPDYAPGYAALASPLSPDTTSPGYELALPDTDLNTIGDPAHTVLLRGRYQSPKGYRVYIYADGHGTAKREQP